MPTGPSDPVFPDAPMIRRLREREENRPPFAVSTRWAQPLDRPERDRLDRIVENHPFMEGAP